MSFTQAQLIAIINANITSNGVGAITGPILNSVLQDMVTATFQAGINTQTSSYTLALSDGGGVVEMNSGSANTVTVPTNATVAFVIGTKIQVTQVGAGATTIAAAGGVTVHNSDTIAAQWGSCTLYKRGTDEWVQTVI